MPAYEIERDRFGVMYSGPLDVGECVKVVPASEADELHRELGLIHNLEAEVERLRSIIVLLAPEVHETHDATDGALCDVCQALYDVQAMIQPAESVSEAGE